MHELWNDPLLLGDNIRKLRLFFSDVGGVCTCQLLCSVSKLVRAYCFPICFIIPFIEICLILPPFLAEFAYRSACLITCINTAPESHDLSIKCCVVNFLWCS